MRQKNKRTILSMVVLALGLQTGLMAKSKQKEDVGSEVVASTKYKLHKKGDFYIHWGYNRSWFEDSNIQFTGQGHDFILYDVKAHDYPSELNMDYVNPTTWSIPQFNFRVGYFINDKYSISLGTDHMKYVVEDNQTVNMYGSVFQDMAVDPVMKENMQKLNDKYAPDGLYNNKEVEITSAEFVDYEHTDGFNYVAVDLDRHDDLWQYSRYDRLGITLVTGVGVGALIPRTDSRIFGSGKNHIWNLAGWGLNGKVGVKINFLKHLYLEPDFKLGWVKMSNVNTSNHYGIDKARQNIVFYESSVVLGVIF